MISVLAVLYIADTILTLLAFSYGAVEVNPVYQCMQVDPSIGIPVRIGIGVIVMYFLAKYAKAHLINKISAVYFTLLVWMAHVNFPR